MEDKVVNLAFHNSNLKNDQVLLIILKQVGKFHFLLLLTSQDQTEHQQDQIHCITLDQAISMSKQFYKLVQFLSLTIQIEISQHLDLVAFQHI